MSLTTEQQEQFKVWQEYRPGGTVEDFMSENNIKSSNMSTISNQSSGTNPGMAASGIGGVASGLASIASGIIGGGARRREQKAAQQEYGREMASFRRMDTSNLAAGMQNTFEDLTVNQQQAQFEAQQQQQGLANTLGAMQGAAGGSGIAALAQAMAGQQSANLQQASASIGQQEAANQMAAAKGAQNVQQMQYAGAEQARGLAQDKQTQLLGMAMERKSQADAARQQATQAIVGGIGGVIGGAATAMAGGVGGDNFLSGD